MYRTLETLAHIYCGNRGIESAAEKGMDSEVALEMNQFMEGFENG